MSLLERKKQALIAAGAATTAIVLLLVVIPPVVEQTMTVSAQTSGTRTIVRAQDIPGTVTCQNGKTYNATLIFGADYYTNYPIHLADGTVITYTGTVGNWRIKAIPGEQTDISSSISGVFTTTGKIIPGKSYTLVGALEFASQCTVFYPSMVITGKCVTGDNQTVFYRDHNGVTGKFKGHVDCY